MAVTYLKKAVLAAEDSRTDVRAVVGEMLDRLRTGGDAAALAYAEELDDWSGPALATREQIEDAIARVPERLKDDVRFAHDNIRRFAEMQKDTIRDAEMEVQPGFFAGQRHIPVNAAGCYVPGGRYSHVASALMTITTARVAGVGHITACSPPKPGRGLPDPILFTMDLAGADAILNIGGVQGVAAMALGLFGLPKSDILVGPGNQFVAEAKRMLFGELGIDMFAGPTDSMVIADRTADPHLVAWDLVGQAEHGYNSPVWLVTDDRSLAQHVMATVPELIAQLPPVNAQNAEAAWRDYGDVVLCDTREEMAATSDRYGPEHLHVQCADLEWWQTRLTAYGSLFLGEETTVAFGDKAAGPNHVLPTSGAARYTGGLSVQKYLKTVTWQRATRDGARPVAEATARISRLEGMEGHARTADIRLAKFFPDETFKLDIAE